MMKFLPVQMTCLLLLLASVLHAEPVAWGPEDQRWLTRESAHFALHYPAGLEPLSERALAIAERVHAELWPVYAAGGALPLTRRTQMVLVDDFDFSNGWATPLPFAQIRLFASAPDEVNGLEHLDDWLHGLIRHEYVHILHLELGASTPAAGRQVFGRLPWFFPHALTPSLFTEGLAVWEESDRQLGYGRLAGSLYPMQMRMELTGQGPDDLAQVVTPLRDWPLGKHYLYGAYLMEFLVERYGRDSLQRYLDRYSAELIPWFMQNQVARRTFGKSWPQLWQEYQQWLQQRFVPVAEQPTGEPLAIQNLGASLRQITASGNGGFALVRNNRHDRPQLVQLTWQDEALQQQLLTDTEGVTDIDVNAQGQWAVSRAVPHASGRVLNDLFLWSSTGWQRVTEQGRFRRVRWLNPTTLVASRQQAGISELWQIVPGGVAVSIWQGQPGEVLGAFDISPDGQWLVATLKRPGQGWNLERLNIGTLPASGWQALTDTRATENSPEWAEDGSILFSADYDGVFNIYRLLPDAEGKTVQQLTHVPGGAFTPRWQNGQLLYQHYGRDGYEVYRVQNPTVLAEVELTALTGRYDYPPAVTAPVASTVTEYRAGLTLQPTWWWPLYLADEDQRQIGVMTGGSDALGRHQYSVQALWDTRRSWASGLLLYQYDNRWAFSWQRQHRYREDTFTFTDEPIVIREDRWTLSRAHLLNGLEDQLQLLVGFTGERKRVVSLPPALVAGPALEEGLAGVALVFDNRERYLDVPGVGWGSYADLVYETNDLLPGNYRGGLWQGQWQQTFDLPRSNTLTLALAGGAADRGAEPFVMGALDGEEMLVFGRDELSLPGYPAGSRIGHRYQRLEFSWAGRLARLERNLGLNPLGFGDVSGRLYAVQGNAWFRDQTPDALTAVGAEAQLEVVLGYHLLVPVRLGVAHGFEEVIGRTEGYLRVGFSF